MIGVAAVLFYPPVPGIKAAGAEVEEVLSTTLSDRLEIGESRWLEADGRRFLAIYTGQTALQAQGGVVILHALGAHADWRAVIHPLRIGLPEHGWHTLSLQMPRPSSDTPVELHTGLVEQGVRRVQAALDFLAQEGVRNTVIIGHGWGAAVATLYLTDTPDASVTGFVAISPQFPGERLSRTAAVGLLDEIKVPVLELYGSQDLAGVLRLVRFRREVRRKPGEPPYRQIRIDGAGHLYRGYEDALVKRVRGWLKASVSGTELAHEQ